MNNKNTIRLTNKNGLELLVNPIGATIIALRVPGKDRKPINVVLGLAEEAYRSSDYLNNYVYLGSTIGRYAGRISKGYISVNGTAYPVYNEDGVSLHGGEEGFDKKIWEVQEIKKGDASRAVLFYESKHMEEGYPGNLKVTATYELTEHDELKIIFEATTDKPTHVNLTNHNYYNLDGEGTVLRHKLKLNAANYLEVDEQLIPSGRLKEVSGTKYDFIKEKVIGENQFSGLDDTFVFNENDKNIILSSEKSGIKMMVQTNQPGVVLYTPPSLNHLQFLDGAIYGEYPAICFETQKYPDAPHHSHFPSTLLLPGELYKNETILTFKHI